MRNIIASTIIASAALIGGGALADDSANANQNMIVESQLGFSNQANSRAYLMDQRRAYLMDEQVIEMAPRSPAAAATSQGFAPVNTNAIIQNNGR